MARLLRISDMSLYIFNLQLYIILQTYLTLEFFFSWIILLKSCSEEYLLIVLKINTTFVKQENFIWDPQNIYFRESVAFLYPGVYYLVYFSRNRVYSFHQQLKGIPRPRERLRRTIPHRQRIYVKASIFPLINSIYVLRGQCHLQLSHTMIFIASTNTQNCANQLAYKNRPNHVQSVTSIIYQHLL